MFFLYHKARFSLGYLESLSCCVPRIIFWIHWWDHRFRGTLWSELWLFGFVLTFSYFKSIPRVKRWVTTQHIREYRGVKEESKRKRKYGKRKEDDREDARKEIKGNRNDNFHGLVKLIIIMNWLNSVLQRTVVWFL